MDITNIITEQIMLYLTENHLSSNLIKIHKDKLSEFGEFSFPLSAFIWHKNGLICNSNFCLDKNNSIFSCTFKRNLELEVEAKIMKENIKWYISMENIKIDKDRCYLSLNRKNTFEYVFRQIFEKGYYDEKTVNVNEIITVTDENLKLIQSNKMNLNEYRNYLLKTIVKNMLNFEGNSIDIDKIHNICCGIVLDSKTGKRTNCTLEEYKIIRTLDMKLIAMHKYGLRAREGISFNELIKQLGDTAVKIDLLEVKTSSPIKIICNESGGGGGGRGGHGNTKGAAFILYNSARLQTLLRKFYDKIEKNIYNSLPSLDEIDLSLLKENEEWQLLFVYIIQFPNMIKRSLDGYQNGNCSIHLFTQYLQGFVSLFSIYYRRIQILIEYRRHLMPTLYARIYLLKALQKILNLSLAFLGIKPIEYM